MTSLASKLPERLAGNPLQAMRSDSDLEAIAGAILPEEDGGAHSASGCGKHLLLACLGYLRDWCGEELRTMENLGALLQAALPTGAEYTDLDNLFYEMESGCKRSFPSGGEPRFEASGLERTDGLCPRDTNGIRPEEDFSLMNFKRFAQAPRQTRELSAAAAIDALARSAA